MHSFVCPSVVLVNIEVFKTLYYQGLLMDLVYLLPITTCSSPIFSSPEHEVLMVSYCGQSMSVVRRQQLRRAASTIALKAYSSNIPGPFDLILGRKHRGDL